MMTPHRGRGGRGGRGGVMVTSGGRVIHKGKTRDDVLEWVKRKRLKQVLKNQRKHREEIQDNKQTTKQKGILAAIVISERLQDDDYFADQQRVQEAIDEYDINSKTDEAAAFVELERKLWIPPRVRDADGLSDQIVPLALDFVDTPETRAEVTSLRPRAPLCHTFRKRKTVRMCA